MRTVPIGPMMLMLLVLLILGFTFAFCRNLAEQRMMTARRTQQRARGNALAHALRANSEIPPSQIGAMLAWIAEAGLPEGRDRSAVLRWADDVNGLQTAIRESEEEATRTALAALPVKLYADASKCAASPPAEGDGQDAAATAAAAATASAVAVASASATSAYDIDLEEDSCALCLEAYGADDHVRTLPCSHVFHRGCIDAWFDANAYRERSCPLCKADPTRRVAHA